MQTRTLASLLLATLPAWGETNVAHLWELKQHEKLSALDRKLNGVLGVATIDLTSGRVFVFNGDAVFPTASSIKIAILVQLYRDQRTGKFQFSDVRTVQPKDAAGGIFCDGQGS